MIPKIIHYCWLSKDPLPTEAQECIKSWKKHMPDWQIKLWDMDAFDIHSVPFVEEAVAARKWAFACDYIRVYALYTEGGVYLDSDVFVRKSMNFMLENRAFSAIESYPQLLEKLAQEDRIDENGIKRNPNDKIHGLQIQAAVLGAEKGHPFFKDCLEYYNHRHFTLGKNGIPNEDQISPIVFAGIAEKYGFRYLNKEQLLDEGLKLYSTDIICPQPYLMRPSAVAVHCCNASWRSVNKPIRHFFDNIKTYLKQGLNKIGVRKEKNIEKIR